VRGLPGNVPGRPGAFMLWSVALLILVCTGCWRVCSMFSFLLSIWWLVAALWCAFTRIAAWWAIPG